MPAPVVLPVAPFAPDLPPTVGQSSANVLNVVPLTAQSYGAIPSPSQVAYGALDTRCQGGVAYKDSNGRVYVFAGSATNLFKVTVGDVGWINVSQSPQLYNTAALDQWQFAYFNRDVIAVQYSNTPQYFRLGTSTAFADLPGAPPKAKYVATVKNSFVVLGNVFDATLGALPQRIQWCAAGNDQSWPQPGSVSAQQVQAGAVDLLGSAGEVRGIVPDLVNADGAVFQEYAVKRLQYVGPPSVFELLPVENARGTPAPYSIVGYGGIAYYLGQDGFYSFDGGATTPIGAQRVDKYFFNNIDTGNILRVIGSADPINRMVWWLWPGPGNSGGNPNYALIYSTVLDRWSLAQITCETIIRTLSIGYSLDQLTSVLGYTSLDNLPASLDSPIWQGGTLQLGLFNTLHQLAFLTGPTLAATVETAEMEPIPGRRVLVRNARPYVDGISQVPTVGIGYRDRYEDSPAFTADSAVNSLGTCPVRVSGRFVKAVTKIPAGTNDTPNWTHIAGVELDLQPQGIR